MDFNEQYLTAVDRLLTEGVWETNERTGQKCLSVFDVEFVYDGQSPLTTCKQSFPVMSVAEMLGYLRGYRNAQQFEDIGCKTWWANSNHTEAWLDNPYRKGDGDIGEAYGVVARDFNGIDTVTKVLTNLEKGVDDRGEIISFWKPDAFERASLRPCMHTHNFNITGDTVNLLSVQRSADSALGVPANAIQCNFLLQLAERLSGKKFGKAVHKIVNFHAYEGHVEGLKEMLERPFMVNNSSISIPEWVKTTGDVLCSNRHGRDYVLVDNYEHHGKIEFEMAT